MNYLFLVVNSAISSLVCHSDTGLLSDLRGAPWAAGYSEESVGLGAGRTASQVLDRRQLRPEGPFFWLFGGFRKLRCVKELE